MKYLAKGLVTDGSTERRLQISRCGCDFVLSGNEAALWLNGRFGFAEATTSDPRIHRALEHLRRMELVELAESHAAGEYRALTRCILVPASTQRLAAPLRREEANLLHWIRRAGLHLTMAELVYLTEHRMAPEAKWLGEANRQRLAEAIYTRDTIQDLRLEEQMEHAACRDEVVKVVLSLLRKKRILLL